MDPATIIREIGGGLAAVVLVAQAAAIIALWRRNIQLTDKNDALNDKALEVAMKMAGENAELIRATNVTLTAATGTLDAAVRHLERR